jgi:hypothetical protein
MSSTKPNSRFSTFKGLFGPKGPAGPAPAPPPKDAWYSQPSAASSSASFRPSRSDAASPTTEELSPAGSAYPGSPRINDPRAPSPAPSRSTTSSHAASQSPGLTPDSAQRKGFRLPGFPRRPSRTPLSPESPPARPDEGISTPWNFQVSGHDARQCSPSHARSASLLCFCSITCTLMNRQSSCSNASRLLRPPGSG